MTELTKSICSAHRDGLWLHRRYSVMKSTQSNRRRAIRRDTRRSTKAICYRGSLGLGKSIGVAVYNVSETGAQLSVNTALAVGDELEVNLDGMRFRRPLRVVGRVVWCLKDCDGNYSIGVDFDKYLRFHDVQEL